MESAEALAAKRRVLIDALMMCLEHSRVVQVVDAKTVRGVLDSAAGELWREGEFRLEAVWKLLVTQPGLTAEDVAPPLLVFKAYENELGVQVRVPQALSAIPRGEQVKLRDALGVQREDFARAIADLKRIAAEEAQSEPQARVVQQPAKGSDAGADKKDKKAKKDKRDQKPAGRKSPGLAAVLILLAIVGVGGGLWMGLRDSSAPFDTGDVAGTLQLSRARAANGSLSATISDPRWDSLSKEDQKKLALQLLDQEAPKGIHVITLSDEKGATRALISDGPNGRTVMIP